jgi:hypothetical protein
VKASELRKLKGKQVQAWRLSRDYIYPPTTVTVLDVQGRNVLVDYHGITDWLWIPDYRFTMLPNTEVGP